MQGAHIEGGAAADLLGDVGSAAPRKRHLRSSVADLVLVLGVAAVTFLSGVRLELHEVFAIWASGYERWQFDELPATLLALAAGLSWFAFRRWSEARAEIERRLEIERRIRDLLGRNRELSRRLIEAQENERRALARELHDELAQTCNAIHIEAACIINTPGSAQNSVLASARRIVSATEALYALVHDMLRRLRPTLLDSLGLVAAIQELCETWESRSGIACRVAASDVPDAVGESVRIALFRIVQEALSNVMRHAHATRVDVVLRRLPGGSPAGRLFLSVHDNGRGIDATAGHDGFGLLGIRERVAALNGEIVLHSAPGRGVRLEIIVPATERGAR